jgi:CHAT domain-containing protein
VTVAPSATTWLTARQRLAGAAAGGVVLVAGPGIAHGEQEVRAIAALYPGSTLLTGPDAEPAGTLAALAAASVVHLAAHGRHQPENPLFSSLDLAGGPLMGYDLTRMAAPPAVVVLAACDLGLADVRPGDEAIGMTTALLAAGTATVVAGVGRIADSAALPVMTALHRELRSGRSPAVALARAGAAETPLVCFGAG